MDTPIDVRGYDPEGIQDHTDEVTTDVESSTVVIVIVGKLEFLREESSMWITESLCDKELSLQQP